MPSYVKLLIFWTLLLGLLWLLFRFPRSRIFHYVATWHGPAPQIGETKSHYRARRALFVLQLFGQSIAILFALALLFRWQAALRGTPVEIIALAMPVVAFLLLASAAWYACTAAKAKWLGPNPIFQDPDHEVEA